ncbi:MAG TPA: hypothetical protein VKR58_03485 [Aquella sp.]|nr:hypothetical protein [Aquella sp.]
MDLSHSEQQPVLDSVIVEIVEVGTEATLETVGIGELMEIVVIEVGAVVEIALLVIVALLVRDTVDMGVEIEIEIEIRYNLQIVDI